MRGTRKIVCIQLLLVLPAIILLNTGCLTRSLWQAEIRQPVRDPNLSLSAAPDRSDVLVQYNEHQSDKVRHRSYWLFEYVTLKGGAGRPRFLRPAAYSNLDLMPIPLSGQLTDDASPAAGYMAVPGGEDWSFELKRDGAPLGRFELPVYQVDAKPTFGRVALTPLAAVADGVIAVGATATIVGGAALLECLDHGDDDDWADDSGSSCAPAHKHGGLHATRRSD